MNHFRLYRHLFIVLIILLAVALWTINSSSLWWHNPNNGEITLQMPPFLSIAKAEANQPASFADDEAGIAAYINVNQTIDLSKVDDLCRTIEEQNANYLLCSIGVPDYDENHDPKVYVHKDGWVMAYYRNSEPTSKIFDWKHFKGDSKATITLEQVINQIVTKIGAAFTTPTYYHFAFPNANKMILVFEKTTPETTDTFQAQLPGNFAYNERSWSLGVNCLQACFNSFKGEYLLNGQSIAKENSSSSETLSWSFHQGRFSAGEMPTDSLQTVTLTAERTIDAYAGLAVVYEVK